MALPALVSDNWYDIRDLGNLSREILEFVDRMLGSEAAYIVSPIIGFVAGFLIFILPSQLIVGVYGERKLIGRIQSRFGPNRVGPFGLLQPIADAIKLIQKEALTPRSADKVVMYIAPIVFVAPAVMLIAVIPFGPNMIIADIPNSLLYVVAVTSLPVLAAFMAGWSHNNKYSLFGSMRIVAMSISYEIPLVIALLSVALMTGSLNLNEMVIWQREAGIMLAWLLPISFIVFFISASAELNRTPADIAEAESEIVAGYLTEYSGMKWGLFYGMDIGYALGAAAIGSTVFLGGYWLFGLEKWVPGWLILITKAQVFYLVFIWTRGTLPRLRIDQLMSFAWKYMLPIALFNLVIVATQKTIWAQNPDWNEHVVVYAFAAINIAAAVALIVGWARLMGYRPEKQLVRPVMVNEATGYTPSGGGQ